MWILPMASVASLPIATVSLTIPQAHSGRWVPCPWHLPCPAHKISVALRFLIAMAATPSCEPPDGSWLGLLFGRMARHGTPHAGSPSLMRTQTMAASTCCRAMLVSAPCCPTVFAPCCPTAMFLTQPAVTTYYTATSRVRQGIAFVLGGSIYAWLCMHLV